MKLYRTTQGNLLEHNNDWYINTGNFDELVNRDNLFQYLSSLEGFSSIGREEAAALLENELLPPLQSQEVWAAGVTYLRSRDARMEESKESGGATFYDKVYVAERPELFFKSLPHRVVPHKKDVYIRKDSTWNVPEPELTLFINNKGDIQGYSIGNDMSSRSIEGENPLYLPQAKTYEKSAAVGPCLLVKEQPISSDTNISMTIERDGATVFEGVIKLSMMKRTLTELASFLYREMDFPYGALLMTGTCLVPDNDFTLQENDWVHITIDGIGVLSNRVLFKPER
ncbi:MAG: fumarylacetoacetate hydrolase family protein [Chitinophagaceae bacterium]|nr:fumarylacetoacetate hydrolase family protein [Chitinophagaceae bacterium]MCW5929214.1 fumarylacetoacetate hydrolase family protein [Chitinophagaceae bacterium]